MKEDVLEQIVDDYLQFKGYFTIHNVRFKPNPSHVHFVGDQDLSHPTSRLANSYYVDLGVL